MYCIAAQRREAVRGPMRIDGKVAEAFGCLRELSEQVKAIASLQFHCCFNVAGTGECVC